MTPVRKLVSLALGVATVWVALGAPLYQAG
jgi:hypothetical protein